jgi:predicted short-subunit dehydrogenase-like oxidoreductase (DUF2520 family)
MKKPMRVGLVVEGNATSSPVLRLKSLREELGPIKSVGLQVARRISNFLRAGYAVTEYRELDTAQVILLRLPDSEVLRIVAELCDSGLPLDKMAFVLCESWLKTDILIPLRRQGAQIASLVSIGPLSTNCFVMEGDLAAVRRAKRVLVRGEARVIEIRFGTKPLYFAANLLATAIPIPAFQLAQQALRESGVSGNDLTLLTDEWSHLLHDRVRKGGRGTWGGPLTEMSEATVSEHFRSLEVQSPELAATLQDWLRLARRQMSKKAKGQTA